MGFFDFWDKDISDEDKQIAYEKCKHIAPPVPIPPAVTDPEVIEEFNEKRIECMRIHQDILYYSKIQHLCIKSGEHVEDDRFANVVMRAWVNCWKQYPSTDEYIEEYGFDPYTTCFHCEKDDKGKLIDEREICNPCNPCINFEYDGDCVKHQYWYMIFDVKAQRFWRHPTTSEPMWDCEEQAIRSWESDTPPKSAGKQQLSFHDPFKKEGNYCPQYEHRITGDPEKDKNIPKVDNSFKWCVPRWNDQCRFFVMKFTHNISSNDETTYTSWQMVKKCNQEECDLAEAENEDSSLNRLARHAKYCIKRCYDVDPKHAVYPAWEGNLVNYTHKDW